LGVVTKVRRLNLNGDLCMKSDQLLCELGLIIGLPDLKFNEEGCACLVFDGRTEVNIESDADTGALQIYADLCPLPAEGREALYLTLLEANMFGMKTLGSTLAVDSVQHVVVLCRTLSADSMGAQEFSSFIEDFVNSVELWREQLQSAPVQPDEQPDQFMQPAHHHGFIRG